MPRPGTNKRKAEDGSAPPATPTSITKKKRTGSTSGESVSELDKQMLVKWLRERNRTTKDLMAFFKAEVRITAKDKITALVKEVATMKDGTLTLRKQYRGPSAAPSPGPA